jgi:hypothetical protein
VKRNETSRPAHHGRVCPKCGGKKGYYAKTCAGCIGQLPTHGLSQTVEYRAWQTMRLRCGNPENSRYQDYGGRGIRVCARWLESPKNFVDDMGLKPSRKHEIDRIDNDGHYSCGKCSECIANGWTANCRWVTRQVNDRNRRSNRLITYQGETLSLIEWSERFDLWPDTLGERLASGWTVERALTTPTRRKLSKRQGDAA